MKNYHIIIFGLCLLLSSCATIMVTYFGDRLTPTTSVDIYYSEHDVIKPYKVIGHLNCPNYGPSYQDKEKAQLSDYAKKIGADAIVITGVTVNNGGTNALDVLNANALKYTN